ncbi:cysteine hydrolase [Candidatus Saccharibacteria bacterium]|nr:cysteine hydrolase [Candidatus Saccharibacteria bacterium]
MKNMSKMTLKDKLNPAHTALIVVDMQNDFCAPTGLMARMGKSVSGMDNVVAGIKRLAEPCAGNGIETYYTQQVYDRTKLNDLQKEQYDLDGKMVTCDINGEGWHFYGFDPPADKVYQKYTYNIFSNDRLKRDLETAGIKTLIITGVSTQICVETAIRNGFDLGYKIVVPADLVATTSSDPDTQKRTLTLVQKTYGTVSSSQEVIDTISNA